MTTLVIANPANARAIRFFLYKGYEPSGDGGTGSSQNTNGLTVFPPEP
jgi:hypothetical protein